jgi:hypothetical protein
MTAFKSMFEKPCISTNKCTGIYNTQQVVETNGNREVIVVCSKCKKTISKFQPS